VPNQLGKEVTNPTFRWIFQILEGIGVIYVEQAITGKKIQLYITNLSPLRKKVIRLFGEHAMSLYGMEEKNAA